jgi:pimeloyl-ACP methyl ester carboxylesterase
MSTAVLGIVLASSLGWTEITVAPSRNGSANAPWNRTIGGLDRPSERTAETLRRHDLYDRYRRDPAAALLRLENAARRSPDPDLVFALAELSWIEARRHDRRRRPAALDSYLDAVAYAYDFLFDPELAAGREPSDPRFRLAIDLYNGSLDAIIRAAQAKKDRIEPGGTITLKAHGRELALRVNLAQSPWRAEDIHELLLASDLEVSGLENHSYQFGLGVPLIAVRKSEPPGKARDAAPAADRYYPPEMAFPLTAFVHPNSRLRDDPNAGSGGRQCTLDLIDPVQIRSVHQGHVALGIEADLTKPLAYMWSRTDLSKLRWRGFLRPGEAVERSGLMMLRPYEPGKIPVVMVHGLMSSPLAWIPMINELLRDPKIQQNYQFFLYVYPTGVPVPIAASYLRDALQDARQQLDPSGTSPAFGRMVLLGHSMGGLLSHAMVVSSGDRLWAINSERPFEEMVGPPDVLAELRHYTFFEPLPFVERVVFLATPHRGSEYARRAVGRLGASLISEPDHYSELLNKLVKDNDGDLNARRFRRLPTSIENLEPDSDVLLALLEMQLRPGVRLHSIIGANRPGPRASTTDGVVTYRSSHLEGVVSELVVPSDHAVQKDPKAILEVRRILMEHIGAAAPGPRPAATASRPAAPLR